MIDTMNSINPNHQDINEWKVLDETNEQGNHYLAHRYNILTTSYVCYAVYEPSALMGNHSSITHNDTYGWLGDVTTRRLPDALEALTPGSQERIKAVTTYLDGWKAFAESLIHAAFPQDFDTFPTTEELEAFYQEARPYFEMYKMIRVMGKPDKYHIICQVTHSPFHFPSIISYCNVLPLFDTREDALRALAIVTMVHTFCGFAVRQEVVSL